MSQKSLAKNSFITAGLKTILCGEETLKRVVESILVLHEVVAISSVGFGYIVFYS